MKRVSVVIPFLNECNTLKATVKNILNIEHFLADKKLPVTVEWLFVDGGSTDGSTEYLLKLGFNVISAAKGRASQMNAGAQSAAGDWIIFLHADTVLPIYYFTEFIGISNNSDWGYGCLKLNSDQKIFRTIEKAINVRSKVLRYVTGDQTLFIKKSLYNSGYIFKHIALMEDVELSRRLYKHSQPYVIQSAVISSARKWLKQGAVKTIVKMWCIQIAYRCNYSTTALHNWYYNKERTNKNVIEKNKADYPKPKSIVVAQFAKSPIRNLVKTRLSPAISPEQRVVLHEKMVAHVLKNALLTLPEIDSKSRRFDTNCHCFHQLWITQPHPFFEQLNTQYSTSLRLQHGATLGDRLKDCIKKSLSVTDAVILIGSDCLDITQDTISNVLVALNDHDSVVIPATDGGFVLLALRCWRNDLFENIQWGTDSVYMQLRENIESHKLSLQLLPAMHDIDRPEDLSRLPEPIRACLG